MNNYNKECGFDVCDTCGVFICGEGGSGGVKQEAAIKGEQVWQKETLEDVFDFFVENYDTPPDKKIISHEAFLDTQKGQVLFRIQLVSV